MNDLVKLGTITPLAKGFLQMAVMGRLNLVVAGSTASGKTNLLNAMCNEADDGDRFILVEEVRDLAQRAQRGIKTVPSASENP